MEWALTSWACSTIGLRLLRNKADVILVAAPDMTPIIKDVDRYNGRRYYLDISGVTIGLNGLS